MIFNRKYCLAWMLGLIVWVTTGCGTGIEDTTRITDKDVKRVELQYAQSSVLSTLKFASDSVASWTKGKRFYVTDDQARLIFLHSQLYDVDSLHLGGTYLTYEGYQTGSVLDNEPSVILTFSDGVHSLHYATNKTLRQLRSGYTVPFLIDMDMVNDVAHQLAGRTLYTRTRIWYNPHTQAMCDGRQFIAVKVDSVLPGDKVLPIKVLFTTLDSQEQAMLRMAGNNTMRSRDFDSMFSLTNPRTDYPDISDENWRRITCGIVVEGMNKQECRLAKGAPKQVNRVPGYDGMHEYWLYDGGTYLYFQDGVLRQLHR